MKREVSAQTFFIISIVVLLLCVYLLMKPTLETPDGNEKGALVIYCAVGMKKPVDEARRAYEKEFPNVKIRMEYGSSGALLSKMKTAPQADLYIPADMTFIEDARYLNLVDESMPLARFRLVLAVRPDFDKKVVSTKDLLNQKINFGQCNLQAGAGRKLKKMMSAVGLWKELDSKKKTALATVGDLALAVTQGEGSLEAGFMWDAVAKQHGLKIVELAELPKEKSQSMITVAVVRRSKQPAWALSLAHYLASPKKGKKFFDQFVQKEQ